MELLRDIAKAMLVMMLSFSLITMWLGARADNPRKPGKLWRRTALMAIWSWAALMLDFVAAGVLGKLG